MPTWKVLVVIVLGSICLGLCGAALIVPLNYSGAERWLMMAGFIVATLVAGGLFALFLRHAGNHMDPKPRWDKR